MKMLIVVRFWDPKQPGRIVFRPEYICHEQDTAEAWIKDQDVPSNQFVIITGDVIE